MTSTSNCCSLEVGAKIIGWVELVKSLVVTVFGFMLVANLSKEMNDVAGGLLLVLVIITIIAVFLEIGIAVLLIVAVASRRPDLMKRWISITTCMLILKMFKMFRLNQSVEKEDLSSVWLLFIGFVVLEIIFILVISRYRNTLLKQKAEGNTDVSPNTLNDENLLAEGPMV